MMEEEHPGFFDVAPIDFDAELEDYKYVAEEYPEKKRVVVYAELLPADAGKVRGKKRDSLGASSSGANCEIARKKSTARSGSKEGDGGVTGVQTEAGGETQVSASGTEDEDDSGRDKNEDAQVVNYYIRRDCKFCPFWGKTKEAVALHETAEHSKASKMLHAVGLPMGVTEGPRRLYYCPRCSFVGRSEGRYVNHHMAAHQGEKRPERKYKVVEDKVEPVPGCSKDIQG